MWKKITSLTGAVIVLQGAVWAGDVACDWCIEDPVPVAKDLQVEPQVSAHYQALRLFLLGRLAEDLDRQEEALAAYEAAAQIEKTSAYLYKELARVAFDLGRIHRGWMWAESALELDPEDYLFLEHYAAVLLAHRESKQAVRVLQTALQSPRLRQDSEQALRIMVRLAQVWDELGNHERAAEMWQRAAHVPAQLLPQADEASTHRLQQQLAFLYEQAGKSWWRQRDYLRAADMLQQALGLTPERDVSLHLLLAQIYRQAGQHDKALEHLRLHLAAQPAGCEGYELLAQLLRALGRDRELVPELERALRRDPFNYALRVFLAQCYAARGDLTRAERLFRSAWHDNPSEATYRAWVAFLHEHGRHRQILEELDGCVRQGRSQVLAQIALGELARAPSIGAALAESVRVGGMSLSLETRRALVHVFRQNGLLVAAEHLARHVLRERPDDGELYLELCQILRELGDYRSEIEVCRQARDRARGVAPDVFDMERARALLLLGRFQEASELARHLADASSDPETRFQAALLRARATYRLGRQEEALAQTHRLLEAAAHAGQRAEVHRLASAIHAASGHLAQAERHLEEALDLDPDDPALLRELAFVWTEQGRNLAEAERLARRALELDRWNARTRASHRGPNSEALSLDVLGWVLFRQGRAAEALAYLEQAWQCAREKDAAVAEHLGDVYFHIGHKEKARHMWRQALELLPTTPLPDSIRRRRVLESKLQASD